jgi:hypothetical protein
MSRSSRSSRHEDGRRRRPSVGRALSMKRKFLRRGATGRPSSTAARLLGRAASPCQDATCRADHGLIHHLTVLVDADTDTLVKGTVKALDQPPRGLQLLRCRHEDLVDDRHLGRMDRPAATETEPAKGIRRMLQGLVIPKIGRDRSDRRGQPGRGRGEHHLDADRKQLAFVIGRLDANLRAQVQLAKPQLPHSWLLSDGSCREASASASAPALAA